MPSQINPIYPEAGEATTASVRANFQFAKDEIDANEQAAIDAQMTADLALVQADLANEKIVRFSQVPLSGNSVSIPISPDTIAWSLAISGLDTAGTSIPEILLQSGATIERTGYKASATTASASGNVLLWSTTGAPLVGSWGASSLLSTLLTGQLMDIASHKWLIVGNGGIEVGGNQAAMTCEKALSNELNAIIITTVLENQALQGGFAQLIEYK